MEYSRFYGLTQKCKMGIFFRFFVVSNKELNLTRVFMGAEELLSLMLYEV